MKILFIHNSIPEYRLRFMVQLSMCCDVKYLITDRNLASAIYGSQPQLPKELNVSFLNGRFNFRTIWNEINNNAYDIVVLPPVDDFFQYFIGRFVEKIVEGKQIKIAYWSEGWQKNKLPFINAIKKYIHRNMKLSLFSKCDLFLASGSKAVHYLQSLGIPQNKIKIAYDSSTSPSVSNCNIRLQYGLKEDAKLILFLGRLVPRKGCKYLISAFDSIAKKDEKAILLIGGEGEDKAGCEILVNRLGLRERIKFVGRISSSDRSSYFKEADVFVLPSYSLGGTIEAWGLTVNESLEQGTPVVATDVVGAAYDLLDGECGIMIKERNVEELASAISHFLHISDKTSLSKKCIERYHQFSVENMAFGFYNAFKTVLNDEN